MSFDLSSIPTREELPAVVIPDAPVPPSPETLYTRRKNQMLRQLEQQLKNANSIPLDIRVGFLTQEDKETLKTELESKGYTCCINDAGFFMNLC